jgi:hypothetical protein
MQLAATHQAPGGVGRLQRARSVNGPQDSDDVNEDVSVSSVSPQAANCLTKCTEAPRK